MGEGQHRSSPAQQREQSRRAANVHTGGGMVAGGDITAGRDVIGRDQIINYNLAYKRDALHQLRAIPETFTGRADEIKAILDHVRQVKHVEHVKDRAAHGAAVTIMSSIAGMGGVGKTELANVVAHALRTDYPDVQLLLELGAHSVQPRTVSQVLTALLQQFEPDASLPESEAELRALYLNALAGKRGIVVIDDARDAAQVKALLPPPGCVALVTSRQALGIGEQLPLKVLPRPEAIALLRRYRADLSDADAIAALCADLPVALTVAGGFLAVYASVSGQAYMERLRAARLDALADEDTSVRRVFAASYQALTPELSTAWRALSVMPAAFDRQAGAAVAGFDAQVVPSPLDELVRLSLIEYGAATGRFRWHDLLREFAAGQATAEEREVAQARHAAWFTTAARTARNLYLAGGENVRAGLALFDRERAHIEAAFAFLSRRAPGDTERAKGMIDLVDAVVHVSDLRFHPRERIRWQEAHLAAARQIGDRRSEGNALGNLGLAHAALGDPRKAIEYHEQALVIRREIGDRRSEGNALGNLGRAYAALGDPRKAIAFYEQCLKIHREIGDRRGEGNALGNLGNAYIALGDPCKAIAFYEQCLAIAREIGDRRGEGAALSNLGNAYIALGDPRKAIAFYEQRLAIAREIGDRRGEGAALSNLGNAYIALGDPCKAIAFYEQRLAIAREIGDRQSEAIVSWNLGLIHEQQGDLERAVALMQVHVDYLRKIGHTAAEQDAAHVAMLREIGHTAAEQDAARVVRLWEKIGAKETLFSAVRDVAARVAGLHEKIGS